MKFLQHLDLIFKLTEPRVVPADTLVIPLRYNQSFFLFNPQMFMTFSETNEHSYSQSNNT